MSMLLFTFDVIGDETCEHRCGNCCLQPSDVVLNHVAMGITNIIIISQCFRNELIIDCKRPTFIADGNLTLGAWSRQEMFFGIIVG